MAKQKHRPAERFQRPKGRVARIAWQALPHRDLYHWFLTLPLSAVAALCAAVYIALNLVFALLYLADPEGIANMRPGSFVDAFFFSVQTIATIGYGNLYPRTLYAHTVVTIESVTGLVYFAINTGLLFARFARPSARVQFTRFAVVADFERVPTLMFRMANERRNQILQAEVHVTLLRAERTPESVTIWRQRDLTLERQRSSFFGLTWTIFHRIDEHSPLWGETADTLAASGAEIAVLLAGVDEVLSQTVHARHTYDATDLRWGYRFADVLRADGSDDGEEPAVDMTRFHDIEPAPLEKTALRRAAEIA